MTIAFKNDEINFLDCQYSNVNQCIFDENSNLTMSCVILNYLSLHDYVLVSKIKKIYLCIKFDKKNEKATNH